MVQTLSDNGANSIWEHSLLDPSNSKISRRKPQPKDPLQLVIDVFYFVTEYVIFSLTMLFNTYEVNQI